MYKGAEEINLPCQFGCLDLSRIVQLERNASKRATATSAGGSAGLGCGGRWEVGGRGAGSGKKKQHDLLYSKAAQQRGMDGE